MSSSHKPKICLIQLKEKLKKKPRGGLTREQVCLPRLSVLILFLTINVIYGHHDHNNTNKDDDYDNNDGTDIVYPTS